MHLVLTVEWGQLCELEGQISSPRRPRLGYFEARSAGFWGLIFTGSLSLVAYKEKMKELPLVSLFCSCFLSDSLNKSSYKYEGERGFSWEREEGRLLCPVFVGAPH